jgi:hypothetical protein
MSRTNFRPFVRRISRHKTVPPELREEARNLLKKPGRPVKKITAEILNEIQECRKILSVAATARKLGVTEWTIKKVEGRT